MSNPNPYRTTDARARHVPARIAGVFLSILLIPALAAARVPAARALDSEVARAMAATHARGLAIAIIDHGKVACVRSYGVRNVAGQPLQNDTVMYAASLTKTAFAYLAMQLVDAGTLNLDRPLARYLKRPLPDYTDTRHYAPWGDLADDRRWRQITVRHALTHSTGFANFAFLEPDGKLRIHFDPGTRYAYSGAGFILLQFVIEHGLGLDVGALMQQDVFDRLGMKRTAMTWRPDFAANRADGWTLEGHPVGHHAHSHIRAAGSMETTIADMAQFAAGLVRGEGLSARARREMFRPQLAIVTKSQFPTLQAALPDGRRQRGFAAGLGVITFHGAQGEGFMKGGHNEFTGNTLVCLIRTQRCVVILANDVRAEAAFPHLVEFVLGETGAPWRWEYGAAMQFLGTGRSID